MTDKLVYIRMRDEVPSRRLQRVHAETNNILFHKSELKYYYIFCVFVSGKNAGHVLTKSLALTVRVKHVVNVIPCRL